jgi:AcrR family transcriptional regulator
VNARERLVEATQELLWARGFTGTSPKAIQRQAEAGQGSMYHHFASKHELARAAIERSAAQLKAEAEQSLATPGTARDKITAYLTQQRDILKGCRIGRLAADPDIVAADDLRRPLNDTFTWLRGRLAEVIRDGDVPWHPDATAAAIVAVVQGGYVLARSANDPDQFDHAVNGLLALLKES